MDLLAYWALLLPLDSHSPFTLPINPLGFYLFPWALMVHLLYFYLSLCPWVWWLSLLAMLAHWAFTSFLGFSWPICLASTFYYTCEPAGLLGFYFFLWALMTHFLLSCFSIFSFFIFFWYWAFLLLIPSCQKQVLTVINLNKYFPLKPKKKKKNLNMYLINLPWHGVWA